MLKFKGKPWQLREHLDYLKVIYGGKTTLKEIISIIGGMKNVNL